MDRYVRKNDPRATVVEAVQLTKHNVKEVAEWCVGREVEEIDALDPEKRWVGINVITWEGLKRLSEGDFLVLDAMGDFHIRWPEQFEITFEKIS